jgi:hypothetical protein
VKNKNKSKNIITSITHVTPHRMNHENSSTDRSGMEVGS